MTHNTKCLLCMLGFALAFLVASLVRGGFITLWI